MKTVCISFLLFFSFISYAQSNVIKNYGVVMTAFSLSLTNTLYLNGLNFLKEDNITCPGVMCVDGGIENLKTFVEKGSVGAQFELAIKYYLGRGVEQNFEQAVYWYGQSAEQGHAFFQYNLAGMYYEGKGVEQSHEQAIHWYRQAAEQGYTEAQSALDRLLKKN